MRPVRSLDDTKTVSVIAPLHRRILELIERRQLEINVQKTIQREVDGEITNVNLNTYGGPSSSDADDHSSSDLQSDPSRKYTL